MWHTVPKPRHLALGKLPRGGDGGVQRLCRGQLARGQGLKRAQSQQLGRRQGRSRPSSARASSSPPCSSIASNRAAMRARSSGRGGSSTKAAMRPSAAARPARPAIPPAAGRWPRTLQRRAARAADRWGAARARSADRASVSLACSASTPISSSSGARGIADFRRRGRNVGQAIGQGHEIKAGAADKDRQCGSIARASASAAAASSRQRADRIDLAHADMAVEQMRHARLALRAVGCAVRMGASR